MIDKWLIVAAGVFAAAAYEGAGTPFKRWGNAAADSTPGRYGFGRAATEAEIARVDIDIRPDGKGLPTGNGTVAEGKALYTLKCASCHGPTGTEGPFDRLVTRETNDKERRIKTIGNYWPYATTLFDYIRRAMPFNEPGSLTDEEVYGLTAYLLHENGLWEEKTPLDAAGLPRVRMPAKPLYIPDDRTGGPVVR